MAVCPIVPWLSARLGDAFNVKTSLTIKDICRLSNLAGYHSVNKECYRRAAMTYLRALAKDLHLAKDSYSVRFNPGGIAVSGDAILHHDLFYLNVSSGMAYWRTCKGRKDYSGDANRWIVGFSGNLSERELRESIDRALTIPLSLV